MRLIGLVLVALWGSTAVAAEVVWLGTLPAQPTLDRVAAAAGASGPPLSPLDLRAAATGWSPADDAALEALEATLRDVRQYESRLDGELVIMRDLERAVGAVTVLRDDADRARLFGALAYAGFAVDRFFADTLATDPRAEPYRFVLNDVAVERPWLDAVAIEPLKKVTPYEVAEAPQRVAYDKVRAMVTSEALPVDLVVADGLPAGGSLVVDGRVTEMSPSGTFKVLPGRHLVHVAVDGEIVARFDVRLDVGETRELRVPLSDTAFAQWQKGLLSGGAPLTPEGLVPSIRALGDVVWVAWTAANGEVTVAELTAAGVQAVELPKAPKNPADAGRGGPSLAVGLAGGWLSSGDFYTQAFTEVPRTRATVNAGTTSLDVDFAWDAGAFRVGAGLWTGVTLGPDHVALTGDGQTRFRPYPYLLVGVTWVQATVGYLFPYHPGIGLRGTVPLVEGLELQATGLLGLGGERTRSSGTTYDALPVYALAVGVGWRFGG